jgi:hypothetical protein
VAFTDRDSVATDQRSRRASSTEISLIPIQYAEGRDPVGRQETIAVDALVSWGVEAGSAGFEGNCDVAETLRHDVHG